MFCVCNPKFSSLLNIIFKELGCKVVCYYPGMLTFKLKNEIKTIKEIVNGE